MAKAVKYSRYGGPEVLEVVDIEMPVPGEGEVLVEVIAAGLNPADSRLREGLLDERMPAHFPQGQGSDFAGLVKQLGSGVTQFTVNDAVIGHTSRGAQATHLVAPVDHLVLKPAHLSWEAAGGLFVTGATAWAAINTINVQSGDTVMVSAATGGVGVIAAQLCRLRGATVIGSAGAQNADFLRQIGVVPVIHDDDLLANIRAAAPGGVDAYLDAFGGGNKAIAQELGIHSSRICSVVDWDGVLVFGPDEYGHADKQAEITSGTEVVARLARLAEQHRLLLPISDIFPLESVSEAYEVLDQHHARGKIVIGMHPVGYSNQRVKVASDHGHLIKQSESTVGVATDHTRMIVRENLPPVVGHMRGQHHPHPSDEPLEEPIP